MDEFTVQFIEDNVDGTDDIDARWLGYMLEKYHTKRTQKISKSGFFKLMIIMGALFTFGILPFLILTLFISNYG